MEVSSPVFMHDLWDRVSSFNERWPHDGDICPFEMAAAGFYYLNERDKVKCPFCFGIISRWVRGDLPLQEHFNYFPHCPYLIEVGFPSPSGYDVVGIGAEYFSIPADPKNEMSLEDLGVITHTGPKAPSYATKVARLKSFINWPTDAVLSAESLSDAGFYYLGVKDYTKCFYCDCGIKEWLISDIPFEEHARWSSKCGFLRLVKGEAFIQRVLVKNNNKTAAENKKQIDSVESFVKKASETEDKLTAPTVPIEHGHFLCKVCINEKVSVVFLPCAHLATCSGCSTAVMKCPVCRQQIKATVKVFL